MTMSTDADERSSEVRLLKHSDPFPAFVWANNAEDAKRIVAKTPRFEAWNASQLRTTKTLGNRFGNRSRYAVRGPKVKYNLDEALAEFRKNPTKHRDARAAREKATNRKASK